MSKKVTFVIGTPITSGIRFIDDQFADNENTVLFNVYKYLDEAYEEAGFGKYEPESLLDEEL